LKEYTVEYTLFVWTSDTIGNEARVVLKGTRADIMRSFGQVFDKLAAYGEELEKE